MNEAHKGLLMRGRDEALRKATTAIEQLCDERGIPIPPTLARDLAVAAIRAIDAVMDERAAALDIAQRAEVIHAEHHPGYIVPSLDSCAEHTREEFEHLVRSALHRGGSDG